MRSRRRAVGRGALCFTRQTLLQRMHDQCANPGPRCENRTSVLAGCNIGIDLARIKANEQRDHRVAVARQIVGISGTYRAQDQACRAPGGPLTNRYCPSALARVSEGRGGKALDRDAVALGAHVDGAAAKIRAQDIAEPRQPAGRTGKRRGPGDGAAFLAGQRESDVGPRHGEPPHHLADRLGLGAIGLEEFQARAGVA